MGLNSDTADGWVKVNDVLTSEYFKDMTKEILMKAGRKKRSAFRVRPCSRKGHHEGRVRLAMALGSGTAEKHLT